MRRDLAACLMFATFACAQSESEKEQAAMKAAIPQRLQADGTLHLSAADRAALGLVVEAATEAEVPDSALRYGRVVTPPGQEGLVVAPVTGRIARAPFVALGQSVQVDDPLLEIAPALSAADNAAVRTRIAELDAQIKATEGELAKRESDLGRARALAQSNIVSQQKLQEAETLVSTSRVELDGLRRARAVQAQVRGSTPLVLKAPVAGVVITLDAPVGAAVDQGATIARIVRPGQELVDVNVAPEEAAGIGYEVQAGSAWLPARLVAKGGSVEEGTRRDRLAIASELPVGLLPGATVSVRVARAVARGVVVPESAVIPVPGGDLVYVETDPNVFASRSIVVSSRFGGKALLASGLKAGEKIVVQGAMGLRGESLRSSLRQAE